jgi:hypothetical protein
LTLPANIEQLNIGQLVAALSSGNAQEFLTAVRLLKVSNPGVDWRLLLGAITAENSSVVLDGGLLNAAQSGMMMAGADVSAGIDHILHTNARGQLQVVPPAVADGAVEGNAQAAAGVALSVAALIAAVAGRRFYTTGGIWMMATGAAAQPSVDLTLTDTAGANAIAVLRLACPANDSRAVLIPPGIFSVNLAGGLGTAGGAVAANTTQAIVVTGYNA